MRKPLSLTSPDNPRLKHILRLRKQKDRRAEGVFIAEGFREIFRALEAGLGLRELYWAPQLTGLDAAGLVARLPLLGREDAPAFELAPSLFTKISHIENPEGLLALFEQPIWRLEKLSRTENDLFLVAAGTNKPGNLGAMARSAAAAGATALLADAEVDSFNPNAIRASTGAVFTLPTISAASQELLPFLKTRHCQVLAASPDAKQVYSDANLTGSLAIVIGAEDTGLPPFWLENADLLVSIPMKPGPVDSLNASTSAAILLFEALRQRRRKAG